MGELEFEMQVKRKLRERNMTMSKLANELNVSVAYISEILRGKRKGVEVKNRIKEYLKIK